jgi:hypothetical protein
MGRRVDLPCMPGCRPSPIELRGRDGDAGVCNRLAQLLDTLPETAQRRDR